MTLTQEKLKAALHYDPATGIWTRLARPDVRPCISSRFGGKPAGNIDADTGYLRIHLDGKLYHAHRLAFLYMTGKWPSDQVDHENRDRADCRWENLREADNSENGANKPLSSKNTSGFKGVYFDKNGGRWTSCLNVNGKRYRKCGFSSPEDAHAAYLQAVAEHGSEFHRDVEAVR